MRRHLTPRPPRSVEPGPAPSFSVIIAAYNAAETIGEAVDSALSQSVAPLEVIVCDDGSSDDLSGALAPFGDRVTLLREHHAGAAAARNTAARAASGDFLAILDADDVYLPERLEALGELAAARPDLDIIGTDAYLEVRGEDRGTFNGPGNSFESRNQRRAILDRCFVWNPAVRRDRMLEVGGLDEALRTAEDWDLWIRLIYSGSKAGLVQEPLARYRMTSGSLTAARASALRGRVSALEKVARRDDLAAHERAQLRRSLLTHSSRAEVAEAEDALRTGAPDGRRRSLRVLTGAGQSPATRLKAAMATAAPGLARRALRRRDRRGGGSSRLERPAERTPPR